MRGLLAVLAGIVGAVAGAAGLGFLLAFNITSPYMTAEVPMSQITGSPALGKPKQTGLVVMCAA